MRVFELMRIRVEQVMQDLYIHRPSAVRRRRPFKYTVLDGLEQSSRPDCPDLPWYDTRESLVSASKEKASVRY